MKQTTISNNGEERPVERQKLTNSTIADGDGNRSEVVIIEMRRRNRLEPTDFMLALSF
jgi:hypothetical protein